MLLTRLPLPLRGVRLACVRPAASVRSEPGSNSQFEMFDSGFLSARKFIPSILRSISIHTETTAALVAQSAFVSVKAFEPQCQSLLRPYDHRWSGTIRQDPAACVSLPSNSIVKEQNKTATTQRPDDTEQKSIQRRSWPRKTTNSHPAGWPFENQKKIEDWTPCRASATPQCHAGELNKQYHSARVNACFIKTSDSFLESN